MHSKYLKKYLFYFSLFAITVSGLLMAFDYLVFSFSHMIQLSVLLAASLLLCLSFSLFTLYRFSGMTKEEAENFSNLKESNYMFQKFLEHSPIYVFFKDAEIRTLALSKNYEQMLGMPVEKALGKTMDDLFPSDLAKCMIEDDKNILKKGEVFEVFEELNEHFYRTLKFPIKEDNENRYLAGFTIDVTDLHNVEMDLKKRSSELQRSVNEYNHIFNTMQDVFFRIDSEQTIKVISPSSKKVLGYTPEELQENSFSKIFGDTAAFISFQKELEKSGEVEHFECEMTTKNEDEIWASINANSDKDENGDIIHINGIIRDITAKRKLQAETLKNKKIESISILAGGIAHDFNNVMTGVMGNISLADQSIDPESTAAQYLAKAKEAMERANILSNQLLTFSSGGNPVKQRCSIKEIIDKSILMTSDINNITPIVSIADNLNPLECDSIQISQALNSIVINALQAVDANGEVSIIVDNHIQECDAETIAKGNYIKITVKDNGDGISPDIIENIFDPFFSTKSTANGLGLTTARSIVKKHGGSIDFHTDQESGSIFSIYLPIYSIPIENTTSTASTKANISSKTHRLLIMDDEEIILYVCKEMCQIIGFDVVTVNDGKMAIDAYRDALEQDNKFDLVIMDLTIPGGMGGKETITKLLEIDPDVKAIVSSGYSNEPIMSQYEKYGFIDAIAKPYNFTIFKETIAKHYSISVPQ